MPRAEAVLLAKLRHGIRQLAPGRAGWGTTGAILDRGGDHLQMVVRPGDVRLGALALRDAERQPVSMRPRTRTAVSALVCQIGRRARTTWSVVMSDNGRRPRIGEA